MWMRTATRTMIIRAMMRTEMAVTKADATEDGDEDADAAMAAG